MSVWQTGLLVSILFHHSNVRLPMSLERLLVRIIVTPRMHGIHHSTVRNETDSNWSSWFTVWDWLHGTLNLGVSQQAITIGVPAYRDATEVRFGKILTMPFRDQRPTWEWTNTEEEPVRLTGMIYRTSNVMPLSRTTAATNRENDRALSR